MSAAIAEPETIVRSAVPAKSIFFIIRTSSLGNRMSAV
jgi:hypothetical protein